MNLIPPHETLGRHPLFFIAPVSPVTSGLVDCTELSQYLFSHQCVEIPIGAIPVNSILCSLFISLFFEPHVYAESE